MKTKQRQENRQSGSHSGNPFVTGVRDLPRNASWLLSKVLSPGDHAGQESRSGRDDGSSGGGVRDTLRSFEASMRNALPGDNSVETAIERAKAGARTAREAEAKALESAKEAEEKSRIAEEQRKHATEAIKQTRQAERQRVQSEIAEAKAEADRKLKELREAKEAEAAEAVERVSADENKRAEEARERAEAARERAEEDMEAATAALREARERADEATAAAQQAADEARREAERLAAVAQQDFEGTKSAVAEADKLRNATRSSSQRLTKAAEDSNGLPDLDSLTKKDLLQLAESQGVDARSSMSKRELVSALRG